MYKNTAIKITVEQFNKVSSHKYKSVSKTIKDHAEYLEEGSYEEIREFVRRHETEFMKRGGFGVATSIHFDISDYPKLDSIRRKFNIPVNPFIRAIIDDMED